MGRKLRSYFFLIRILIWRPKKRQILKFDAFLGVAGNDYFTPNFRAGRGSETVGRRAEVPELSPKVSPKLKTDPPKNVAPPPP